jgi:hypothetical protein
MRETVPQARLQGADLIEELRRKARAFGVADHAPQCALIGFEPDGQLIELLMQPMRVERDASGPVAVFSTASPEEVFQSSDLAVGHRGGV